ncbi:MAG: putative Fe-S cluster assembly protein SufT [Gammaproteobacteria bacterium]|nr:putative Fe-S cluster assembly protein SufT [Gammaproteobacteria bacterium]MDD9824054.1 putative Fe-S cluster assembly protein SufT [Gammaproteobacteria bacterium]MDD9863798.1 putative Fe-S cluster assembly protein SufT [Gammaproteobacteria bacterium]
MNPTDMADIDKPVTLERDCAAVLIPAGTRILLPAGSVAFIVQALGGGYTLNVNGNLARVAGKDADALGFDVPETEEETAPPAAPQGDGSVEEPLIWEKLRGCYDPEIPINIVDLGLIYDCKVTPLGEKGRNRVEIAMTLTAPGCGMGQFLAEDVRAAVASVPNVTEVNVELTFEPPWDQSRMSEAARLEAGLF